MPKFNGWAMVDYPDYAVATNTLIKLAFTASAAYEGRLLAVGIQPEDCVREWSNDLIAGAKVSEERELSYGFTGNPAKCKLFKIVHSGRVAYALLRPVYIAGLEGSK